MSRLDPQELRDARKVIADMHRTALQWEATHDASKPMLSALTIALQLIDRKIARAARAPATHDNV